MITLDRTFPKFPFFQRKHVYLIQRKQGPLFPWDLRCFHWISNKREGGFWLNLLASFRHLWTESLQPLGLAISSPLIFQTDVPLSELKFCKNKVYHWNLNNCDSAPAAGSQGCWLWEAGEGRNLGSPLLGRGQKYEQTFFFFLSLYIYYKQYCFKQFFPSYVGIVRE